MHAKFKNHWAQLVHERWLVHVLPCKDFSYSSLLCSELSFCKNQLGKLLSIEMTAQKKLKKKTSNFLNSRLKKKKAIPVFSLSRPRIDGREKKSKSFQGFFLFSRSKFKSFSRIELLPRCQRPGYLPYLSSYPDVRDQVISLTWVVTQMSETRLSPLPE